jgi:thiaminase (transcriptional activator TenA)
MNMREQLAAAAAPVVAKVIGHPFWHGLRQGTLPGQSLWYFAQQDAAYVVPAYARALARTAAMAEQDSHSALLCSAAAATFEAATSRMPRELAALARDLGRRPADSAAPIGPEIHAYTSFMAAAGTSCFAAGAAGLLPMTWFHLLVTDDLRERHGPGTRYAAWIGQYCQGEGYRDYVMAYLGMIDEVGEKCSDTERACLARQFLLAAGHEWALAEAAWRCRVWPV